MKRLLLLAFLLVSLISYGQKYAVRGIAIDSTNGRTKVSITLNDTIRKYIKSKEFDIAKYQLLRDNKNFFTKVNDQNKFEIKARLTDSLTFSSWRHTSKSFFVSDLISKKEIKIILDPQDCDEFVACEEINPKLYVFIGKKILSSD